MREFVTALIECSITMSVLVLGFIAATPWLSKRYSAKWLYYTWLVLVIGLIIPFRVHPDTAFIQMSTTPDYTQPILPGNVANIVDSTIPTNTPSQELPAILWFQIGICLWAAGLFAFIVYHGLKHFRFLRMVSRWSEQPDKHLNDTLHKIKTEMGITTPVKLQICSCISSPMMIGFIRPTILLPWSDFSADEMPYILRHELVHLKRKDLWYKSLVLFATAVHWFNPVMYVMARAVSSQCEISCDAEVVSKTDIGTRRQYSEALIGVIKNQSRRQTAFSTNFYGGKKDMKNRIFSIMDTSKKRAGVLILCLVVLGTLGTGAAFAVNDAGSGAYSTSTPISAQEQEKLNQQTKEATAKNYAVYEKYGLTYDNKTDSFYYNSKLVRYFSDKLDADGTYNSFTRTNGVMDLKAVRNANYELTGITPVSQEEYDKHTESLKNALASNKQGAAQENGSVNKTGGTASTVENETGDIVNGSTAASSEGDPNYVDNSLNAYLDYGVSYDKDNKQWVYGNKPIHYLYDEDHTTYVDESDSTAKSGVSLEVVRKSNGQIEKLVDITN
ncbi:M56 family metallopeptidase [Paenibacillus sp. J22TS3]|uniref:M56 family metallopeptidase n=1 Tax=Paenibacillus sp. J22TS3 TaxID=2807192 RepID=UPI001BD0774F|nr:M56 family metallopeptidase [Paenibacillus sp. J22TS3]